jgi:hypothetical protein
MAYGPAAAVAFRHVTEPKSAVESILAVMHPGSRSDRVIEAMRISSSPLDDDQLADRTGISPRQSVNQLCRELERAGMVRRRPGPHGKIVNEWLGNHDREPDSTTRIPGAGLTQSGLVTDATAIQTVDELPPGSSREQRDAERIMLDLLSQQVGRELNPARLTVPSGERVEVDGADANRSILVECWAHQGPPKSAQRHKVLADALKLTWISTTMYPRPRLILCLSDPQAAAPFLPGGRSWAARAFQDLGVTISVVDLPTGLRHGLLQAQRRQYR